MVKKFKQIYDRKNLVKISLKMMLILILLIIISFFYFTMILGSIFIALSLILIFLSYLKSTRKIILTENELILKKNIGVITFDLKYVGRVEKLNYKHIINLKKQNLFSLFSFFGKDGRYKSKLFSSVRMISTSDKFKDNILMEYGIDFYILSVDNRDSFIELLLSNIEKNRINNEL